MEKINYRVLSKLKKYNSERRWLMWLIILIMTSAANVFAQKPLSAREKSSVVSLMSKNNVAWNSVALSGKLKLDLLPISPSVKIFMIRDSVIRLSLRVPLMGEVGRAEIDKDSILVVNKMKKTFVKEPIGKLLDYYPGSFSDLQEAILGRVVVPGYGILSKENGRMVDIFTDGTAGYTILPTGEAVLEGINYGYLVDSLSRTSALAVVPTGNTESVLTILYDYKTNGYNLSISYKSSKKSISGTLELDNPQWNANGFSPIEINSRFRRLDFKQFMKSF